MTETLIHWDPLFPIIPSIVVAVVVLAILLIAEIRRRLKYKILRAASQVILVVSVLLLVLRPSFISHKKGDGILLLTEGSQKEKIDSVSKANPRLKLMRTEDLSSLNELTSIGNEINYVAGTGLPGWAIDLLPEKNFQFVPSPAAEGIESMNIPERIYAHRWNQITGVCNLLSDSVMIKLRGPGSIEDSVLLRGPGKVSFSLSYFAKAPGRFNYEVILPSVSEVLPLVIEPERTMNIIFISDYPTFEVRYLKNFLTQKGHRLAIRNQVSRGKYKFEFANRPSREFQTLTTALLNDADLLLIDERSWNSISAAEQRNIRSSINEGLGVIILPESSKAGLVQFSPKKQKDTVRVSLSRAGVVQLPALRLELKPSESITLAGDGNVMSGYRYSGGGKIGYMLLLETYQAGLQGKADAYAALWAPLLEKCARNEKMDFKIRIASPFPVYENQPIDFDIVSSGREPHFTVDNISYPLTEDLYVDDLWHGKVWLEGSSWHEFKIDSTSTWFHLAPKNSWKTVSQTNNLKATQAVASSSSGNVEHTVYDDSRIKIILFLLFVIAAGFLWLSPKL